MSGTLQWKLKGTSSPFNTSRVVRLPCTVEVAREQLKEECGMHLSTAIEFVLYLPSNESEVLPASYMLAQGCQVLVARCAGAEARELMAAADKRFSMATSAPVNNAGPAMGGVPRIATSTSTAHSSSAAAYSRQSLESQAQEDKSGSFYDETTESREFNDAEDGKIASLMRQSPNDTQQRIAGDFDGVTIRSSISEPSNIIGVPSSRNSESALDSDDEDSRIQAAMQERDFFGGEGTEAISRRYYRNRTLAATGAPSGDSGARGTAGVSKFMHSHAPYSISGSRFDHSTVDPMPVDANYICHMCGQRGHHIKNCVQPDGKRIHKKVRPATGIPVDFLQVIGEDEIGNYEEVYHLKSEFIFDSN